MPSFDITERVVTDLGVVSSTATTYANSRTLYDWAIAGLPFLSATSDKYPFERYTAPIRKQQFDTTQEVGEQSLEGWWIRSQATFHAGAGLKLLDSTINGGVGRYLDQTSGAADGRRFLKSTGVDIWTPGTVTLLKATTVKRAAGAACRVVGGINAGVDCFFQNNAGSITREDAASTAITGWAGTVSWLATTGAALLGSHPLGIDSVAVSGTTAATLWTQTTNQAPKTWWVKQRLIAARNADLFELPLAGGNLDVRAKLYTHPLTSWAWTSAVETPNSILVAGYAGSQSSIYKFVLDTAGALPVLTAATISAALPEGELVKSMYCYLGTFVAIGTNRGIRIGVVSATGDVTYGPLTVTATADTFSFTGKDRFIYATSTNGVDGSSGLYRIDLSQQIAQDRYAYATDLQAHITGVASSVCQYGASGRLVFTVDSSGSYLEHATNLEPNGYLQTALVRYGTMEPKLFKLVRVRTETLGGALAISTVDRVGVESSLYTVPVGAAFGDEVGISYPPAEAIALKFTLNRGTDPTTGANLTSYQLKALPATPRKEMLHIPLRCSDREEDRNGVPAGGPGTAMTRYSALREAHKSGDVVTVQDLNTGETLLGVIEDLHFQQSVAPSKKSFFGGVFYATVRTV